MFKGPFNDNKKQIVLMKVGEYYHGCRTSWDVFTFISQARPASIKTTYTIIRARERNVALVVKPRVTTIVGVEAKQPLVHALDAIVPSSANNA